MFDAGGLQFGAAAGADHDLAEAGWIRRCQFDVGMMPLEVIGKRRLAGSRCKDREPPVVFIGEAAVLCGGELGEQNTLDQFGPFVGVARAVGKDVLDYAPQPGPRHIGP